MKAVCRRVGIEKWPYSRQRNQPAVRCETLGTDTVNHGFVSKDRADESPSAFVFWNSGPVHVSTPKFQDSFGFHRSFQSEQSNSDCTSAFAVVNPGTFVSSSQHPPGKDENSEDDFNLFEEALKHVQGDYDCRHSIVD